ncbi:Adenine phosphoribosyltransferase [compost metagenome]
MLAAPVARVVTGYRAGGNPCRDPLRPIFDWRATLRAYRFQTPMADSIIQSPELGDVTGYLRERIRTVPDWPMPGVMFRDITPLLQNPKTLRVLIDVFVHRYMDAQLDLVAGIDARGFILGAIVAYELNLGFVPIRKKGKLPFQTVAEEYELEYGSATVEIHADACKAGDRVLLVDDLIATGGTMMAGRKLLERLGATVVEGAAIVDLPELGGSKLLQDGGLPLFTVCKFEGH